jgi:hypothetical protein
VARAHGRRAKADNEVVRDRDLHETWRSMDEACRTRSTPTPPITRLRSGSSEPDADRSYPKSIKVQTQRLRRFKSGFAGRALDVPRAEIKRMGNRDGALVEARPER